MKEQLDLRTLMIYLLSKLKESNTDNEYIKIICILLSKQSLFILTQERVKDPFITLEPKDVSYFLKTFTIKEICQELKNLLKDFKNIEDEPYCSQIIFEEVQHHYVVSLINSVIDRLLITECN